MTFHYEIYVIEEDGQRTVIHETDNSFEWKREYRFLNRLNNEKLCLKISKDDLVILDTDSILDDFKNL